MASIRKRGNSYLLVVSMGYDPEGHRRKPQQKTVHPPEGLTPKAKEKWLEEEAALFERQCKNQPLPVDKSITLAEYTAYWLGHIAPGKLAHPLGMGCLTPLAGVGFLGHFLGNLYVFVVGVPRVKFFQIDGCHL